MRHRNRLVTSLFVGLLFGAVPLVYRTLGADHTDFDQVWIAARAVIQRSDPYTAVAAGFPWPFYYPLPAALIGLPFSILPRMAAACLWTAVGFGALAYALSAEGWWPLLALMSVPALDAARLSQWSPILTASALLPTLSWIAIGKPSTGGAVALAYLPRTFRWCSAAGVIVLFVGSFAIAPHWLSAWRSSLSTADHLKPLVMRFGGSLLLLAVIRWRRPEARLLVMLSLVPQTAYAYEALPLILTLRTRRETLTWALCSTIGGLFLVHSGPVGFEAAMRHNAAILLILRICRRLRSYCDERIHLRSSDLTQRSRQWASQWPG